MARARVIYNLLGYVLILGLIADLVVPSVTWSPGSSVAFSGFFLPGLVGVVMSIIAARLLVPFVVARMGGDDGVAGEMMAEAGRVGTYGVRGALVKHAAHGTVAAGPSAQRNAMALPLIPLIAAIFMGLIGVANSAGAGPAQQVECTTVGITQKNDRFTATVVCALPTGEERVERIADAPPPAKFTGSASRGLLGVWLLDFATINAR